MGQGPMGEKKHSTRKTHGVLVGCSGRFPVSRLCDLAHRRSVCVNEMVRKIKVLQPEGVHVSGAHMPCHKVATGLSDTCKRLEALSIAQNL